MFSFLQRDVGFNGNLSYRTKLHIDAVIENLRGSSTYIKGRHKIELDLYEILDGSSGECLEYLLSQIYDDKLLYARYSALIFEIGYQNQKDKKYEKLPRHKSSRNVKEIKPRENEQCGAHRGQNPLHGFFNVGGGNKW